MIKNYLKTALRNIMRYKGYSLINITGLSVGLSCFFLILVYVDGELSYDKHYPDYENIYRLYTELETPNGTQTTAQSAPGWARYLNTDFAEVALVTRIKPPQQTWKVELEEKIFYESGWTFGDSTAFEMFGIELIDGNPDALSDPYSVVVSQTMADKYFGMDNPIGQTFRLDNQYDFNITGVFEDLPKDSHFKIDFLASFVTLKNPIYGNDLLVIDNFPIAYTYLKLHPGTDPAEFEAKLPGLVEKYIGSREQLAQAGMKIDSYLQPITDIHLQSHLENEIQPNGQLSTVYIFIAIAFFILTIAGINFVNLSTARSLRRAREVGLRKAIGATKDQLVIQFLGEAVLMSLMALALAILLILLVLPVFATLIGKPLDYFILLDIRSILILLGVTVGIGLLSGLYPAFIISSFKPTDTLTGSSGSRKGNSGFLRKVLIVFQFGISILLVISTGVMYQQMEYINNFDVGLNQSQLLTVQLTDPVLRARYRVFKAEVEQIPSINSVSAALNAPADVINQAPIRRVDASADDVQLTHFNGIDFDFIETLGIKLVAGRDLSQQTAADTLGNVLINETAVRAFGWKSPEEALGQQLAFSGANPNVPPITVIGVVSDYHMQSVHENISPTVLSYLFQQAYFHSFIDIETDISGTLKRVEEAWMKVMPNYPFQYAFLDDNFDKLYTSEQTLGRLLTYFSVLTIFIACLGLYGLASFMVEQRRKEIGVRKVLGASEMRLMVNLSNEYTFLIVIAFVLSAPLAYYAMNQWLQTFQYKIDIALWTFGLSLLFALVISWLTVSYKSYKAAKDNPVNSIRSE